MLVPFGHRKIELLVAFGYSEMKKGMVIMHNRFAFADHYSREESRLIGLKWAIEVMNIHRVVKVVVSSEAADLVGAINRPKSLSSLALQRHELQYVLN